MSVNLHALAVVLICAGATVALRALPFICFGGKRGVPRLIASLGSTLPPAIMAALVIYCLKSVPYGAFADGARQLIAAAAVVALHIWKRNTLLSIGVGTVLYMILIRL
ncbi:MAG: AzlD domain-containing protein [Clostridia bacterium]|nr:AzlD domain-containing protein [Clostridia bacterium]